MIYNEPGCNHSKIKGSFINTDMLIFRKIIMGEEKRRYVQRIGQYNEYKYIGSDTSV